MEPIKTYKVKESVANLGIYGGIALGAITLIGFFMTAGTVFITPLALSIFITIMGFMNRNKETIKLFENHMELKFAPAASKRFIKYQDIIRLEDKNKSVKKLFYMENAAEKNILIPVGQHNEQDMLEFTEFQHEKISHNQPKV